MRMNVDRFRVRAGDRAALKKHRPDFCVQSGGKEAAIERLQQGIARLRERDELLYAQDQYALLVVFQGVDAAGKDTAIKHVMSGLSPQATDVHAFKVPSSEELHHDYLWRVHNAMPENGQIGIFNRSHYEDVLIVRVHGLVPKSVWQKRYRQINDFERMLSESGVRIVKFLLYIGKEEQAKRFRLRLDDKGKNWKFSLDDIREREYWDDYIAAYNDVLEKCSTAYAPWHVIPANRKWFRNLAVAQVLVETLESMKLKYPKPTADLSKIRFE